MAKVNGNIFMEHLSGMIGGQLVLKRARGGGTIISKKPTFRPDRVFSAAQLAQQQAFREATAYGKAMKREPIYLARANDSAQTGYNRAVAAIMLLMALPPAPPTPMTFILALYLRFSSTNSNFINVPPVFLVFR